MTGRVNGIEAQEHRVDIAKGGTRSQEYRDINPLGKLPCLQVKVLAKQTIPVARVQASSVKLCTNITCSFAGRKFHPTRKRIHIAVLSRVSDCA